MVDTLEKFQQGVVNVQSEEGKQFILFKRQLYQMYEVQNRSIDEHQQFSLSVDRKNLKWLYKANLDFVSEMKRVNHLDNLVEHGSLKGSIFKAKFFSPRRLRGAAALAGTFVGYTQLATLSMLLGPNVSALGLAATAYYGMMQFYDNQSVTQIDYVTDGEFTGWLLMKVQKSPFSSTNVLVHPKNCVSAHNMWDDELGGQYMDSHVIHVNEYINQ